jgi:hypothetical protein
MADSKRNQVSVSIRDGEDNNEHFEGNQYRGNTTSGEATGIYGEVGKSAQLTTSHTTSRKVLSI